jgi:hypothetical protein
MIRACSRIPITSEDAQANHFARANIKKTFKIDIFLSFIVNSSVLIPNLLELFFSDHWVRFYRIQKAPGQKKTFWDKNFFKQYF